MELISFFASFSIVCLWGYIGYQLALKKGRNPKIWCLLALLFNMIPIVILSILKKKEQFKVIRPVVPQIEPEAELVQENWYYLDSNRESKGPMSFSEIKNSFDNGILTSKSFVWNDTYSDWKKLEEDVITIKELEKKANS